MGTVEGFVGAMARFIGIAEVPRGSNKNILTKRYGVITAWCDIAVSLAGEDSGNAAAVGREMWTVAHARWFRSRGEWHYGLGGIRRGDIVFFDWSGTRQIDNIDHVGVVEKVFSNGTIGTIEGNVNDMCLRKTRNSQFVVGYGRPSFSGGSAPLPPTDGMLRKGSTGPKVEALQVDLNVLIQAQLDVDGEFGDLTEEAVKAFQKKYGLVEDGEVGPATSAEIARRKGVGPPVLAPLDVDGEPGPLTWAQWQRQLNKAGAKLIVDGEPGPLTWRAIQAVVGVEKDGEPGPVTWRAIQLRLNRGGAKPQLKEDGEPGKKTWKAIQESLNAGKF